MPAEEHPTPDDHTPDVHRYFQLAAVADTDAYFEQFTADAVVEDEGVEHHGLEQIRSWRREIPRVNYSVDTIVATPAGPEVQVDISGDFPGSPVRLGFRFGFAADGHIRTLTIRP